MTTIQPIKKTISDDQLMKMNDQQVQKVIEKELDQEMQSRYEQPKMEQVQQEQPKETIQTDSSTFKPLVSDMSHLDGLIDDAVSEEVKEERQQLESLPSLTREQFKANMAGMHNVASSLTGIQNLSTHGRENNANNAFDALYDYAGEITWLRFLRDPENVNLQRMIALGSFYVPVCIESAKEVKQKFKPKEVN